MMRVSVPATSANLGVGFDCLGLALDLRAEFTVEAADELVVTGCEERFRGRDNLVWTTYLDTCATLGASPEPLAIDIQSPVPLSGGLGSSSTCVVAGVAAALARAGRGWDVPLALDLATKAEGHPDNVAPAVLGGLVSSFVRAADTVSTRMDVADNVRLVLMAPPDRCSPSRCRSKPACGRWAAPWRACARSRPGTSTFSSRPATTACTNPTESGSFPTTTA